MIFVTVKMLYFSGNTLFIIIVYCARSLTIKDTSKLVLKEIKIRYMYLNYIFLALFIHLLHHLLHRSCMRHAHLRVNHFHRRMYRLHLLPLDHHQYTQLHRRK